MISSLPTRGRWDLGIILTLLPLWVLPTVTNLLIFGADHNLWTDWKDTTWWPLATAPAMLLGIAAMQYVGWTLFRIPLATVSALATTALFFAILTASHAKLGGYPFNFVWPATVVPTAIILDCVLVFSRRIGAAAFLGGFLFGALFYSANALPLAPFHEPVVKEGRVLTVANLQGFEYHRSSAPEYLRIIQVGGLHSFNGQSSVIAAGFTGVVCIASYLGGIGLGRLLVVWPLNRFLDSEQR